MDAGVTTDAVDTNWHVFKERAHIRSNDTVLVVGAGGGVGIHCVQMAKVRRLTFKVLNHSQSLEGA